MGFLCGAFVNAKAEQGRESYLQAVWHWPLEQFFSL